MKPIIFWVNDDSVFIDDEFIPEPGWNGYVSLTQFEELNQICESLKNKLRALGIRWENKVEGTKDLSEILQKRYAQKIKDQKAIIRSLEDEIVKIAKELPQNAVSVK